MNIKKINLFLIMFLTMLGMEVNAQGVIIYQNDDTRIEVPYSKLDSIVTYEAEIPKEANWVSIGMATIVDDILLPLFGYSSVTWLVEIQENSITPGQYRLVNPFGAAYSAACAVAGIGIPDYSTDELYIEINAQDPDGVWFELQSTGCDWGYGEMKIASIGWYYMDAGNSFDAVKNAGYMGTFANGIISFPVNGCIISDNDGSYYANPNGAFKILFPRDYNPISVTTESNRKNKIIIEANNKLQDANKTKVFRINK